LRALRSTLWVVGAAPGDADRFPPGDWRVWDVSDIGSLAHCWAGAAEDGEDGDEDGGGEEAGPGPSATGAVAGAGTGAGAGTAGGGFEPPAYLQRLAFGLQAARGLAFLHAFEPPLLHRDVKSTNLLLTHTRAAAGAAASAGAADGDGTASVNRQSLEATFPLSARLGDFGDTRALRAGQRTPMTRETGTPQWMAPEVMVMAPDHSEALASMREAAPGAGAAAAAAARDLEEGSGSGSGLGVSAGAGASAVPAPARRPSTRSRPPVSRSGLHAAVYGTPADVYSLAVILFELVTGLPPFGGARLLKKASVVAAVAVHHCRPRLPAACPAALAQLVRRAWHPDPQCRPSAAFAVAVLEKLLAEGLRQWQAARATRLAKRGAKGSAAAKGAAGASSADGRGRK
jgi:serine/threonine protein kinase